MPVVPIVRTSWGNTGPHTMGVKVENEKVISLISSPLTVAGTAAVWSISETARPGRKPVSQVSAPGLRTATFEHKIQNPNLTMSIENLLLPIRTAAEKGKRVQFFNGGMLVDGVWWLVKSLDIEEIEKARDNRTSRATLSWSVVEANTVKAVELSKTGIKKGTVTRVRVGGK